jgi:hypothetical protein
MLNAPGLGGEEHAEPQPEEGAQGTPSSHPVGPPPSVGGGGGGGGGGQGVAMQDHLRSEPHVHGVGQYEP